MAEPDFTAVFEDAAEREPGGEPREHPGEEPTAPIDNEGVSQAETAGGGEADALSAAVEQELNAILGDAGMVNPYTNEEIRTKADFLRWKQRFQADTAARSRDGENRTHDDGARTQAAVDRELAKIRRWDSNVKTLADIADNENFPAVYEKVMRGYDLADAFYLVNAEGYQRRAAAAAEQTAINRLRAKEHLVGVGSRGGGDVAVPREVMAEFRRLMPDASGEEIRKFYRKDRAHLKNKKG